LKSFAETDQENSEKKSAAPPRFWWSFSPENGGHFNPESGVLFHRIQVDNFSGFFTII
jgi:hypothetical protein